MNWENLTKSQKAGWIILLFCFFAGVYSVTYHVTLWSFYAAEWIEKKISGWKFKRKMKEISELYNKEV